MIQNRDSIDRMRIASPCPMNWEAMKGDDHARFCDACSLHVYNISEMTRREVETLIAKTEGRVCARLYKRADGTVLTRDCPVGLRAIRRRVSKVAGAFITAIFSLCLSVKGQSSAQEEKSCPTGTKVTIESTQDNHPIVRGIITDVNGAVLSGVTVVLVNRITQEKSETVTNKEGLFKFVAIVAGSYDLEVKAADYSTAGVNQIDVETSQAVNIELQMMQETTVTVGILLLNPLIEVEGPGLKTSYSPKQITSLPF